MNARRSVLLRAIPNSRLIILDVPKVFADHNVGSAYCTTCTQTVLVDDLHLIGSLRAFRFLVNWSWVSTSQFTGLCLSFTTQHDQTTQSPNHSKMDAKPTAVVSARFRFPAAIGHIPGFGCNKRESKFGFSQDVDWLPLAYLTGRVRPCSEMNDPPDLRGPHLFLGD
ncbi:hypothetical protein K504DRAFT_6301 [Pleomassaria siparia CBS 279.74]|uniref:Uncharacterized protein n=1 Tax=Pleomassaria siparia CBS 279.74 TaxID=1314801 RepID=A0A6G1KP04_9PLEO|nr:hypothetical protein K504DRAFT_6301 [Pleomassaria siparia CBS 279.74]